MSKVIVVDDEPFILMMIEDKLKKAKIDVITLKESKKAVELVRKEKPDLIILDLIMPVMDGEEFYIALRAQAKWKKIPVGNLFPCLSGIYRFIGTPRLCCL